SRSWCNARSAARCALAFALTLARLFQPERQVAVRLDDVDAHDQLLVALVMVSLARLQALAADDHFARERQVIAAPARRRSDEAPAAEVEERAGVKPGAWVVTPVGARLAPLRQLERQLVVLRDAQVVLPQLPPADHAAARLARGRVRGCLQLSLARPDSDEVIQSLQLRWRLHRRLRWSLGRLRRPPAHDLPLIDSP